ncbi:hypothetical protein [Corallococcus sp. M7]
MVTINGRSHLLGNAKVSMLGLGWIIRAELPTLDVVTLRPVRGTFPNHFHQTVGSADYPFTVPDYPMT